MAYIYNMADTWADAGVTFTAIKMNVLDTASNAASLLMDLQVGGSSRFNVTKSGSIVFSNGTSTTTINPTNGQPTISQTNAITLNTSNAMQLNHGNNDAVFIRPTSSGRGRFALVDNTNGNPAYMYSDAANALDQRNGTNAQTFRVYNTFTDASNYERGFIRYSSNQLEIGHEAAGTGSGDRLIVIRRPNAGTILDVVGASTISARIGSVSGFATAMGVGPNGASPDIFLFRRAAGIGAITGNAGGTTGAALEFIEQTAPAAPATNGVYIYAEDNGSGKTRLMARFATGSAVQIAVEP